MDGGADPERSLELRGGGAAHELAIGTRRVQAFLWLRGREDEATRRDRGEFLGERGDRRAVEVDGKERVVFPGRFGPGFEFSSVGR